MAARMQTFRWILPHIPRTTQGSSLTSSNRVSDTETHCKRHQSAIENACQQTHLHAPLCPTQGQPFRSLREVQGTYAVETRPMNHGERGSGPAAALFSSSPMVAYDARPRSRATASPAFTKSKAALTQSNCSTSTCLPHLPRKRESTRTARATQDCIGMALQPYGSGNATWSSCSSLTKQTSKHARMRPWTGRSAQPPVLEACCSKRVPGTTPPPHPCTETRQRHVGGRHGGTITYLGSGCQQLTCAPRAVETPSLQPPRVPLGRYQRRLS